MLKELKFVQGAVAKKDLLPAMTHFKIEGGYVRSFNGSLAICSPIPFDIDCIPKADQLVKAISQCNETVTLSMTPGKRLRIQSGKFRAFIECVDGDSAHPLPEGEVFNFDGEQFLKACQILSPFIGNDASRAWSNGIRLKGQSAYATNNAVLVEYWLGGNFPIEINIPRNCIAEILRIGEAPLYGQLHERSVTFHFSGERWIRTQLLDTAWPDLDPILNVPCNPVPVPQDIFDGIEMLRKMSDPTAKLYFSNGLLRTHLEEFTGAAYEVDGVDFEGCYSIAIFALLAGVVTTADFTLYPAPCMFFGERLRGAIIGMRT